MVNFKPSTTALFKWTQLLWKQEPTLHRSCDSHWNCFCNSCQIDHSLVLLSIQILLLGGILQGLMLWKANFTRVDPKRWRLRSHRALKHGMLLGSDFPDYRWAKALDLRHSYRTMHLRMVELYRMHDTHRPVYESLPNLKWSDPEAPFHHCWHSQSNHQSQLYCSVSMRSHSQRIFA